MTQGFPVVGVGASAGGLEAFASFFQNMPVDTGMAFALIQHIQPSHVGSMVSLIQKYTHMPVIEAKNQTRIEPNHVYMIPQDQSISVSDRTLVLTPAAGSIVGHSIDPFFRSLAADLKERAICVILSGTGSDGTMGARAVKAEAGLVLVQEPADARYDGMPRAAIDAGVADAVIPAAKMGEKLIEYVRDYHGQSAERRQKALEASDNALKKILAIVHMRTKRDFSGYKTSTINRRIDRRMSLSRTDRIEDYLRLLQEDKQEANALANDFLIQVTSFFRDPEAFAALKVHVQNMIETSRKAGPDGQFVEVRGWVAGCSTGEEAYSIAILLDEVMEELHILGTFQVFATDLDAKGIQFARAGIYPESIAADVGKEHLKKYFDKRESGYQIKTELRERVVFAVHDLIGDAPFSRIDLASVRNLLIYLDSATQKKVVPLLHYSLKNGGILFLGTAETIGDFTNAFVPLDRKWKIYRAIKSDNWLPGGLALTLPATGKETAEPRKPAADVHDDAEAEKALLRTMPPAVVIDNNMRIVYVHGETGRYLRLKQGKLSSSIIDMARDELRTPLSTAIYQALSQRQPVVREEVAVKVNGESIRLRLTVKPTEEGQNPRLIVLFEEIPETKGRKKKAGARTELDEHNKALEQELQFTRENLKSTVEELETANEELRSTNEEYQSTNEELHSTNEELETSKEELQSVNEELNTINNEYQKKIEELSTVNDDMKNILNSTSVATIFLDEEQRIKRFTPTATKILNLMDRDIGRPFKDITSTLKENNLTDNVRQVLETLVPVEREIHSQDGKWYSLRIYPYRTTQNAIAGIILSFIDVTRQKQFERQAADGGQLAKAIFDTIHEPTVVLDGSFRIVSINKAFSEVFKVRPERASGATLYDAVDRQLDVPSVKRMLEETLTKTPESRNLEIGYDSHVSGHRKMLVNATRFGGDQQSPVRILLAFKEAT